ncbi:hypothetical protein SAMN05443245_7442 [Paraburkholderia fungorum]|uniref:RNA-binding protein n=1 Tax=Paraburkholderia fungorum TaxID=134537 RepID=A0A1H1JXH8_9BURK|nr:hypothetical protein SAMN05443245_7442 [Paraburkholderia fungorum]
MYPGRPRSARESIDEDVSTAVLFLPLKGFYFDEIRAGRKPEEFRLETDHWRKRLVGRHYDFVLMTRGYPRADDFRRQLLVPWRGYVPRTITHPHFGIDPVAVFAIDVGGQPQPDSLIAAIRFPSASAQCALACRR